MHASILIELTRRYTEPHRHYHTLEHVADMLHQGRALALTEEQVFAVWFHDAIYDPRSDSNEQDSAALARTMLSDAGHPDPSISLIEQIVLDTKPHRPSIPEAAPVIDLDLCSLAAPWDVFERNRVNIRREYEWVPEAEYEQGCRDFFVSFLARDRLFHTEWGAPLEASARANLERALRR